MFLTKLKISPLRRAIEAEGFIQKADHNGSLALSLLDPKEWISVLQYLGEEVFGDSPYRSIVEAAVFFQYSSFEDLDLISTPSDDSIFPVTGMRDLYIREAYKDLFGTIDMTFAINKRNQGRKRIIVTGTSGVGKSAFLVYFAIRLLATSRDDNPPFLVFQNRQTSRVYVYGGLSVLRSGDIEDFEPFLDLPETWFLVDSVTNPLLRKARTILAVSPNTLNSETSQPYKEVTKRVSNYYYMAPWTLDELKQCREKVGFFNILPEKFMEECHDKIGGVPRYVLEIPADVLGNNPDDLDWAKEESYDRVRKAIKNIKNPKKTMQYFEQAHDTLEFSGHLLHHWPTTDDHRKFRLEWASIHIRDEVAEVIHDDAWKEILNKLVDDDIRTARGPMFELYVLKTLRNGGDFLIRDLDSGEESFFEFLADPTVERFKETLNAPREDTLCIPKSSTSACVDLLLSPRFLFLVTVSREHSIKGPRFQELVDGLVEKEWVEYQEELQLIFIVPKDVSVDYPKQKFLTAEGTVYKTLPPLMENVMQSVLVFDLKSASEGKFPELKAPAL